MTEKVLEGIHETMQYAERYFETMEAAIEFTRWISPRSLAINPVNTEVGLLYQLTYNWAEDSR